MSSIQTFEQFSSAVAGMTGYERSDSGAFMGIRFTHINAQGKTMKMNHRQSPPARIQLSNLDTFGDFRFSGSILALVKEKYEIICLSLGRPINTTDTNIVCDDTVNVTQAIDGTTINMYYYANRWVFSTDRGYSINNFRKLGRSYEDVLLDIFKTAGLSIADLNTEYTYTFIYNHNHIHMCSLLPGPDGKSAESAESAENSTEFANPITVDAENKTVRYTTVKTVLYNTRVVSRSNEQMPLLECLPSPTVFKFESTKEFIAYHKSDDCTFGLVVDNGTSIYWIETKLMKLVRESFYSYRTFGLTRPGGIDQQTALLIAAYNKSPANVKRIVPAFIDTLDKWNERVNKFVKIVTSIIRQEKTGNVSIHESATALAYCKKLDQTYQHLIGYPDLESFINRAIRAPYDELELLYLIMFS